MPNGKTSEQMIQETYDRVNEMWTMLCGVKNTDDKGLVGDFNDVKSDYYRFKRVVIAIFAFLVGSGILGVGIWKLL